MDPLKHAPLRINDIRSKYKIIDKVGKGTYGTVFKVQNLEDHKYYAIKKFENTEAKLQVEGFPITALRQISLLKQLNHPNIVNLKQIICSKPNKRNLYRGSTFMVFDYMHHDFSGLFRSKIKFSKPEIKCIMKQLLEGCNFLHQNKVMHRDIKSANILMNDQGIVQLADFGLGRRTRFDNVYTYKVVTLWYRAPQLLLGCKSYNHKVDVWSLGCVFAEFLIGQVLFKKQTEYAIIDKIYEVCGGLEENQFTQDYLRGCAYYHDMRPKKSLQNNIESYMRKLNPSIDQLSLKFLKQLLELNPYKRLSCEQALNHQFFSQQPLACQPQQIQQLQVEYHEMFRDRSMKIQRKPKAQRSPGWSEQNERKEKRKQRQLTPEIKNKKPDQPRARPSLNYNKDKPQIPYERSYERPHYDSRYNRHDQRRHENTRNDYSRNQHSSNKYQGDDRKNKRRHSRSQSQSSSSSSSSSSRRSKSKHAKRHRDYRQDERESDIRKRPYGKEKTSEYRKRQEKSDNYQSRNDQEHRSNDKIIIESKQTKQKYPERERITIGQNGNRQQSSKGYEPKSDMTKKDVYSRDYREDSRKDRDKGYQDRKKDRKQPYSSSKLAQERFERKQHSYRTSEKDIKEESDRSYTKIQVREKHDDERRYSSKNQKLQPGEYRNRNYQPRNYQDKNESSDYHSKKQYQQKYDRDYEKSSRARDDYARKQYNGSSKNYDSKHKEKQYRYNQKYDRQYSRKQYRKDQPSSKAEYSYKDKQEYRNKDYRSRNISIQNRSHSPRRSSPSKKGMDTQY